MFLDLILLFYLIEDHFSDVDKEYYFEFFAVFGIEVAGFDMLLHGCDIAMKMMKNKKERRGDSCCFCLAFAFLSM